MSHGVAGVGYDRDMSAPRTYTNGEIVVLWDASKCTHSGRCVRGLPEVFDVRKRPWINMLGADTQAICDQVDRCPSGALTWFPAGPDAPHHPEQEEAGQ